MGWKNSSSKRGGLGRWLVATGSLSARLVSYGQAFGVQVLAQGRQPLTLDEARVLGVQGQRMGYAREVVLRVDGQPLVFARSVTAHTASNGAWLSVRGLGSRPLADVLFRRSGISRQALAFTDIKRQSPLQRHVDKSWQVSTGKKLALGALSARRSVFMNQGAALMVMEVFAAPAGQWKWPDNAPLNSSKRRRTQ
jgi:chorismate--pyruvate lyase